MPRSTGSARLPPVAMAEDVEGVIAAPANAATIAAAQDASMSWTHAPAAPIDDTQGMQPTTRMSSQRSHGCSSQARILSANGKTCSARISWCVCAKAPTSWPAVLIATWPADLARAIGAGARLVEDLKLANETRAV